ncbi:dsRBD fold-containing protein [Streptomyces purpurogeneiscleroticus]|uniref:dsRBD fold-containing protein n=1 Tax=Streptomyces purpurogeneiscleroticus TaxID=68259 RepID=UPI001CC1289B|nr:dsRBD fold-containing protein [Streptomyces purpurogeneiscleroticus]
MSGTSNAERLAVKEWKLRLHLYETGPKTTAWAVLDTGDNVLEARGHAHQHPHDAPVPEIGDELAAGRALVILGQQLIHYAAMDVEGVGAGRLSPEK